MFREKKKKYNYNSLFLIFMCLLFCFSFFPKNITTASADSVVFSNVLDDLKKDENFDINDYPTNFTDYSLNVIQIAEGSSGELFVYVYQPSAYNVGIIATCINMSIRSDGQYRSLYNLMLCNYRGTLFKYVLYNFSILEDNERFYDIASIYRPWDSLLDDDISDENGNTISEVSYSVGKLFVAKNENDVVNYYIYDTETIQITDKYVGFVRYPGGLNTMLGWGTNESCDAHFVAFNTDKSIDHLLEAEVYYCSQSYYYYKSYSFGSSPNVQFGDMIDDNYSRLRYDSIVEYQGTGWYSGCFSWNRIQTVETFLEDNYCIENSFKGAILNVDVETKLTEDGINDVSGKKWILRFVETPYEETYSAHATIIKKTLISDVSILRLKFETNGETFDLGVVDNKQTGDFIPDNETTYNVSLADWLENLIFFFFIILFFVVFWPFIPSLVSAFIKIIKALIKLVLRFFKGLFKIFIFPLKLFRKRK